MNLSVLQDNHELVETVRHVGDITESELCGDLCNVCGDLCNVCGDLCNVCGDLCNVCGDLCNVCGGYNRY